MVINNNLDYSPFISKVLVQKVIKFLYFQLALLPEVNQVGTVKTQEFLFHFLLYESYYHLGLSD